MCTEKRSWGGGWPEARPGHHAAVRTCASKRTAPDATTITAHSSKWLLKNEPEQAIDTLGTFLHLGDWVKEFLHSWFKGTPITDHADACHLTKILRHSTAHGVLSPAKCHGLGFTEAPKVLPKTINDIRAAVICRLYDCHHRGNGINKVG